MTLKYIQIETTTTCNQRCNFCPVSVAKRPKQTMSLAVVDKIISSLRAYNIEKVFVNGFNEPTYDKQLVEKVRRLHDAGFSVDLNTNGSGLTPKLTKDLLQNGVVSFTINISTLDATEYLETRGNLDIKRVIPHIEYLLEQKLSQKFDVILLILGHLDKQHGINIQSIAKQFAGSSAQILICPIADFAAGATQILSKDVYHKTLRGCVSERQNQWLHFTPDGSAILCCQDYFEQYKIGNIAEETVTDIHQGEQINQLRRWISGEEVAPEDFICRSCVFAISDETYAQKIKKMFCDRCVLPNMLGIENACQRCAINSYLSV